MKIVQVIPTLSKAGGAEKFVIDLTIAQQNRGNEVLLIVLYKNDINFFQADIDKYKLRVKHLNKKKGFDFKNSQLLKRVILSFNPDIVHTHINCHLSMKLSGLWDKKNGISYFHTIHSVPERECRNRVLFRVMRSLYKKKLVEPITISDSLAIKTQEYYGLKNKPAVIYNGIFLENFKSSKPIITRENTFISVASFQANKNQIMIAKAATILRDRGFTFNIIFLGDGAELKSVETFSKENNMERYLSFKGEVSNVNDYLSNSKCLVLPSWAEGNPISILEAMSAGLAVIVTKVGGAKDIILPGINGYLVDPSDLYDLVDKMEAIILDKEIIQSFSENNIAKSELYDMDSVSEQYIKLYNNKINHI